MDKVNESSADCTDFERNPYEIAGAVSAAVSALCCIFVICLIFLLKKHYFFIQRLILYHCLAALFDTFAKILRLQYLAHPTEDRALVALCTASGYINLLSSWILIVDYSVLTFTLMMTAVFHRNVTRLERLYFALIFVLPLTFTWIPFIGNSFGEAGGYCWLRSVNYDDCTRHRLGETFRIVLWYVPLYSILTVMIPTYLFIIAYTTRQRYCKTVYNPEIERLRKELYKDVWRILFFPFGVIFLNLFVLIITVYTSLGVRFPDSLLLLYSIFNPLQGGYIAIVYVFDRHTLKQLTYKNVKAIFTRRETVTEYPAESSGTSISDSAECSLTAHYGHYTDYEG